MMELSERHEFTLLHVAFGLLHERGFGGRKHVVWVNRRFPLDADGIAALSHGHKIALTHVEVVEDFTRDNHLAPLAHAPDPLFRRGSFLCHAFSLAEGT